MQIVFNVNYLVNLKAQRAVLYEYVYIWLVPCAAGSFSFSGVVYGVLASAFVALNSIYTSRTLKSCEHVQNNVWRLALFNNANGVLLFLPLILLNGELPAVYFFPLLFDAYFWFVMVVSGARTAAASSDSYTSLTHSCPQSVNQ